MPDNMSTEALVGGYFNGIVFLGEFLGPVIGGKLMDSLQDIPAAMGVFTIICFTTVCNKLNLTNSNIRHVDDSCYDWIYHPLFIQTIWCAKRPLYTHRSNRY